MHADGVRDAQEEANRRKEEGLCVRCGENEPENGKLCEDCQKEIEEERV